MSQETANAFNPFKPKFDKLMVEFTSGLGFTERNLSEVRLGLNQLVDKANHPSNAQQNTNDYTNQLRFYVEAAIPVMIHILEKTPPQMENNEKQNLRFAVLEFLQKKVFHTQYSNQLVEAMVDVMERDNEKNSAPAPKILNEVIKSCSNRRDDKPPGVSDRTLMKVFDFLDRRIEFISQLGTRLQQTDYNPIAFAQRNSGELRPNNQSIQFIGMIPHIYVHMMAYTGGQPNQESTPQNIRDSLRRAIQNMLKAMKDTPYQEILQRMPRWFSSDLFNAYQKLAQFLFIILRRDKDLENSVNLMKHVKEQLEYIKHDQVIAIVIKFLKNCPADDLIQVRTDLVYRMRAFLSNRRDSNSAVSPQEQQEKVQEIMNNTLELIDDEYIYGKETRLAPMIKSNLQIYWLETVKVLLTNYLPQPPQQRPEQQAVSSALDKVLLDFLNNQVYMEKIFDTLLKILFDQQTCLPVHEKTLELIKLILEQFVKIDKFYFVDKQAVMAFTGDCSFQPQQQQPASSSQFTIDQLYRANSLTLKYKLMNRLFDMVGRKLGQLRKMLVAARLFLEKHKRWGTTKKQGEVFLTCMPCNVNDSPEQWQSKLKTYIQESDINIDENLLSLGEQQQCYVHCFEDEEELILNSTIIQTYAHYQEFVKEVKSKIIDNLVEITQKLMNLTLQTNQGLLNYQQTHSQRMQQDRLILNHPPSVLGSYSGSKKLYLSPTQTGYMSRLLKNGLLIFEELHDPKQHFELLIDKRKNTPTIFMSLFAVFHEPSNFKDIFEPNSSLIVRLMVKFHSKCAESHCIGTVFLEPFIPQQPPGQNIQQNFDPNRINKNILEFLITVLLKEMQLTPEFASQYGYCRSTGLVRSITQREQDEYISIIQKLVRLPIRLFPRIKDDAVFRPIIKQLVLFLVKKLHESFYPGDYLGLLISFVKRIQTSDVTESLCKYFQTLCEKPLDKTKHTQPNLLFHNLNYAGINIVHNLLELYKTGAVEIQDTISELVVHLPLSKSHLVQMARQYPVYAECLYRALHYLSYNDASVVQRTLSALDHIVGALSQSELETFFGPMLGLFLSKLIVMTKDTKLNDQPQMKMQHFTYQPDFRAMKILAKLGPMARNFNWEVEVESDHHGRMLRIEKLLEVHIEDFDVPLTINMSEIVRCASDMLQHLLDNQLASYMFKLPSVDYTFKLVKTVVLRYIEQNDDVLQDRPLLEKCIRLVTCFVNITNVVSTLSTTTMMRVKEESEQITENLITQSLNYVASRFKDFKVPHGLSLSESYNFITLEANRLDQSQHPLLVYLRIVLKCFHRRVLMTCDDSLASRDVHAYLYEFIWVRMITRIFIDGLYQLFPPSYENDIIVRSVVSFLETQLINQVGQEGLFERTQNPKRAKDQVLQAFGGPNTQSDGLNLRTACLEALISLQDKKYQRLPPCLNLTSIKVAYLTLSYLPEIIKLRTTIVAKELVLVMVRNYLDYGNIEIESEYHRNYLQMRDQQISRLLAFIVENTGTYKEEVCKLQLDILRMLPAYYGNDWGPIFYMNLQTHRVEDYLRYKQTVYDPFEYSYVRLSMFDLKMQFPYCFLTRVLVQLSETLFKIDPTLPMSKVRLYTQGFTMLEFIVSQMNQKLYLFNILEEDHNPKYQMIMSSEQQIESQFQHFLDTGFKLIEINEKQYGAEAQLIFQYEVEGQQNRQQCQINHTHSLDDLEYGINIEDIDLDVKTYVNLLKYIFLFFKSVLTLPVVQGYSKFYQRRIDKSTQDQQKLLAVRFRIVKTLYEGLTRVETTVRKTAYKAIQELLLQEGGLAKELFQNDDKLKLVMKPVLTCLQQDTFSFVPSFLYSLKMILKLFTQVFHRTLSDRMQIHLQKIVKEQQNPPQLQPHQYSYCTSSEWSPNQSTPESLHFQTACVQGILQLFQHLTASFHQNQVAPQQGQAVQAGNQAQVNPANEVIKETIKIEKNYKRKVGRCRMNTVTRKPLAKFLNTVAAFVIEGFGSLWRIANYEVQIQRFLQSYPNPQNAHMQNMMALNQMLSDKHRWIKMMTQMVKEEVSYPLRERFTRETTNFSTKLRSLDHTIRTFQMLLKREFEVRINGQSQPDITQFQQYGQIQNLVEMLNDLQIEIVEFAYQLTKRNPSWLKNNDFMREYLIVQVNETLRKLTSNTLLNHLKQAPFNKVSHHLLPLYHILLVPSYQQQHILERLASLLIAYCTINPGNEAAMVSLLLTLEHDRKGKVRLWIDSVANEASVDLRKQLLVMWLRSIQLGDHIKENENTLSRHLDLQQTLGYMLIYPILLQAKQHRGDLDRVVDIQVVNILIETIQEVGKDFDELQKALQDQVPIMKKLRNIEPQTYCGYNQYFTSIVVDLLQVSSFVSTHTSHFEQAKQNSDHKIKLLHFGYTMCRSAEKLISYFGKLYMGKFFRVFKLGVQEQGVMFDKMLKFYHQVLKFQDENINSQDQEIVVLCRKIISVIIPYLDQHNSNSHHGDQQQVQQFAWVNCTLQIFRQEHLNNDAENMQKLCRFWLMFIHNHQTFQQHHLLFTNHIINSMQQIGCYNQPSASQHPPQSNPSNLKRIALDIAFLSIEWKFKAIKKHHFNAVLHDHSSHDERLSQEIHLNFFIKQALLAQSSDEKDLLKRSLYLLKKILIISPGAIQKLNLQSFKKTVENQTNQLFSDPQQSQTVTLNAGYKFFLTVTTVLNIVLEFQPQDQTVTLLNSYLELLGPSQQPQPPQPQQYPPQPPPPVPQFIGAGPIRYTGQVPPRQPPPQPRPPGPPVPPERGASIHQQMMCIEHPHLVFYISCVLKKLIRVAQNRMPQADVFYQNLFQMAKETIEKNLILVQQQQQIQQRRQSQMYPMRQPQQPPAPYPQPPPLLPMVINQAIFTIKEMFDFDSAIVSGSMIGGLREAARSQIDYLKKKEKSECYLGSLRQHPRKKSRMHDEDEFEFKSYMEDFLLEQDDFPFGVEKCQEQLYFPDDFPEGQKLKYHLYRTTVLKILKMLAFKFNETSREEQQEFVGLLRAIIEQVGDYELKMEAILILRLLFINFNELCDFLAFTNEVERFISRKRADDLRKSWDMMKKTNIVPAIWSHMDAVTFFLSAKSFQMIFDRKLDHRAADCCDNSGAKIQEIRVVKIYFAFICEFLLTRCKGLNSLRVLLDRENLPPIKTIRTLMLIVSKLPSSKPYLKFFYRCVFHMFGDRCFFNVLVEDQVIRMQTNEADECHPSIWSDNEPPKYQHQIREGEEILLMGIKLMILGKGVLHKDQDLMNHALHIISSEYLPSMVIYGSSHVNLSDHQPSPLKDLIIPQAALALMGPAANISSRILKPLFFKLMKLFRPLEASLPSLTREYQLLVDYLQFQGTSSGMADAILVYLVDFANHPGMLPDVVSPTKMTAYRQLFDRVIGLLMNKSMYSTALFLIEELQAQLGTEHSAWLFDLDNQLLQLMQSMQDRDRTYGIWYANAGQPWVRQLIFEAQLREPRRCLERIFNELNDNNSDSSQTHADNEDRIQLGLDGSYVQQIYTDSLVRLNQWTQLKKLSQTDRINLKIDMGIRERSKPLIEQAWKELQEQKFPQNIDFQNYCGAIMKFLDIEEYFSSTRAQQQNVQNNLNQMQGLLQEASNKIIMAQLVLLLEFSRLPPSDFISYDQSLSNMIVVSGVYKSLHEKLILYDEIEEVLKPPQQTQTQNHPNLLDTCQENAVHIYQVSINCQQSYRDRINSSIDDLQFHSQLSNQRMLLQNLNHLRFMLYVGQIPPQHTPNNRTFKGAFFEPNLPLIKQLRKQGLLHLMDLDQMIKDAPESFRDMLDKHLQFECVKQRIRLEHEYQPALVQVNGLIQYYNDIYTNNNSQIEDNKLRTMAQLYRYKVMLNLNLMQLQEHIPDENIDQNIFKALEFPGNQWRVYRDIQQCFFEAHRKYNNNIQFAHNVITLAPLAIRYKPRKTNPEMIQIFYLLLISNPTDSYVIDAFSMACEQLPAQVTMLYMPQLVYIINHQSSNEQLREAAKRMLAHAYRSNPQYFYHQDPQVHALLSPDNIHFYSTLGKLYQKLPFEDALIKCATLLDHALLTATPQQEYISSECLKLIGLLGNPQNHHQLQPYSDRPLAELIRDTQTHLSGKHYTALFNDLSQIYLTILKLIFHSQFGNDIGLITSPIMTTQLAQQLYQRHTMTLPIDQIFELSQATGEIDLPDQKYLFLLKSSVKVKGVSPSLVIELVNRKAFKRTITLISESEKKHSFVLQRQSSGADSYWEKQVNLQFMEFMNIMLVSHKESQRRFMEVMYDQHFYIYHQGSQSANDRKVYSLSPQSGTLVSCSDLHDQQLVEVSFRSGLDLTVPYYGAIQTPAAFQEFASSNVDKLTLQRRFLKQARTFDTFQALRKSFNQSLATQIASSHIFNCTPQLDEMIIDLMRGKFYHNNQQLQITSPNPNAIRFSRNLEKLCGELGVNSYLCPGFGAIGLALSQPILHYPIYLRVITFMRTSKKTNDLQRKINSIVFNNVDSSTSWNYHVAPIHNKLPVLLEVSKKIFSDFGQTSLRPWF